MANKRKTEGMCFFINQQDIDVLIESLASMVAWRTARPTTTERAKRLQKRLEELRKGAFGK